MSHKPGQDPSPNAQNNAAEAIAAQPPQFVPPLQNHLHSLGAPNTGSPRLTAALKRYLPALLETEGVAVPDEPEEMRWRLFFAHSQDMYGFRADIFTGGPNEADHPTDTAYQGLRDRWPDGGTMIAGLAALWLDPEGRKKLETITNPFRAALEKEKGIAPAIALLRGPLGNDATRVFADAYEGLKGAKIAHKTNTIVRAYCQNAAVLAEHGHCFRTYLRSLAWPTLPSDDISVAERAWVGGLQRDFYNVGPALAPYLVADWLLSWWIGGSISWFSLYKADSVFLKATNASLPAEERYVPLEATQSEAAFVAYCRTLRLPPEWIPARLWHLAFYNIPPRLVNEVIWLDNNQSTPLPTPPPSNSLSPSIPVPPVPPQGAKAAMLSPADIRSAVRTVLEKAETALTSYEILGRLPAPLRDQLIAERGLPGAGSSKNYSAASLVTQAVEKLLPTKEPPYRVYANFSGKTFTVAGQTVTPSGSAIATYRLSDPGATGTGVSEGEAAAPAHFATVDAVDYSEETLSPPGHTDDPNNPYVLVVSTVEMMPTAGAGGDGAFQFAPLTVTTKQGHTLWAAFTSRQAMRQAIGDGPSQRQRIELSALVDLFVQMREAGVDDIKGIVLDPSGPEPQVLSVEDMERCLKRPLNDARARELHPGTLLPARLTTDAPITAVTRVASPVRESDETTPDGERLVLPVPMTLAGGDHFVAFTSHETLRRGTADLPFPVRESALSALCALYLSVGSRWGIVGIIIDPFEQSERRLTPDEITRLAEMPVESTAIKAADILDIAPPRTLVSAPVLAAIGEALRHENVDEAWATAYTYTDGKRTLMVYVRPLSAATAGRLWHRVVDVLKRQSAGPGESAPDVALSPLDVASESLLTERGEKLLPNPQASWKQKIGLRR
jgi:hypothetical protein